ncbi:4'-phosphopantetheinyl transferase superfamily protein [Oceanicoccus sp. KOV_DT_Chl]|uniref:4'-phosphopantetheinyl transferase family protein n=1 Tax=Oceanicoccus sp. KOV_DT_Chl TaxID=1904639 RepID=UPI000C7CACD0|nr:4'-phosphopantetheinyl transferase superfamily protein [Oceanicoccus sp. KOV_DT_Chl]
MAALNLNDNEVHIWRTDIQSVPPVLLPEFLSIMSLEERERNQRFKFEQGRFDHALTRALVRTVLSRYCQRQPEEWRFTQGEHGKPELVDAPVALEFNLSHSCRFIVCAVSKQMKIGVDVEHTERKNSLSSIADRFFSEQEVKDLFALPAAEQSSRFFDYWTLKEAYMKARGEGISLGLGNFGFSFNNEEIAIAMAPILKDNPADWYFELSSPSPDQRMALAVKIAGLPQPLDIQRFDVIPLLTAG